MYWSIPIIESGTRVTAPAKNSSGTAVTGPTAISSTTWPSDSCANVPLPDASSTTRYAIAGTSSTSVSSARLSGAPTSAIFFSSP